MEERARLSFACIVRIEHARGFGFFGSAHFCYFPSFLPTRGRVALSVGRRRLWAGWLSFGRRLWGRSCLHVLLWDFIRFGIRITPPEPWLLGVALALGLGVGAGAPAILSSGVCWVPA